MANKVPFFIFLFVFFCVFSIHKWNIHTTASICLFLCFVVVVFFFESRFVRLNHRCKCGNFGLSTFKENQNKCLCRSVTVKAFLFLSLQNDDCDHHQPQFGKLPQLSTNCTVWFNLHDDLIFNNWKTVLFQLL